MGKLTATSALILLSARVAFAVDVTSCGQVVGPREAGVLVADLDCSGAPEGTSAVILSRNASLDLQGHTLTGATGDNTTGAVLCDFGEPSCMDTPHGEACRPPMGRCLVTSTGAPGEIRGNSVGILSDRHLTVSNVHVATSTNGIAFAERGILRARDVSVEGGSSTGIYGGRMLLSNVSVTGTGDFGIFASLAPLRGTGITANGNARGGIIAGVIQADGVTANDNGSGPAFGLGGGIFAGRIELSNSTVTGNLFGGAAMDLASPTLPAVVNTTCGTSAVFPSDAPYPSWGVCAND